MNHGGEERRGAPPHPTVYHGASIGLQVFHTLRFRLLVVLILVVVAAVGGIALVSTQVTTRTFQGYEDRRGAMRDGQPLVGSADTTMASPSAPSASSMADCALCTSLAASVIPRHS